MKAKLIKESLSITNDQNFLLNLIEGLMHVLLKGNHPFIDFKEIHIQSFEQLDIIYTSPIPPKKHMEMYIGRSKHNSNYFLDFHVGKHAGQSFPVGNWDPSPNMDENIKDIVDAMSYWGWKILPENTKRTYEEPYSRIWEERSRRNSVYLNESSYDKEWVDDVISQVKTKLKGTVITPSQGDPKRMERVKNVIIRHIDDFPKSEKEAFVSELKNLGLNLKDLGINESLKENYEVFYSDGVKAAKKFKDYRRALSFMEDKIKNNSQLRNIELFRDVPGFHSTAQEEYLIAWWGEGSYWDNKSKREPELLDKWYPHLY